MTRRTHIWAIFTACLVVALAALVWISAMALWLDRSEADMRRQAVVDEKVRRALGRMDWALTPFVNREIARPYFSYSSFYPAERAYTRMYNPIQPGEILMPSPLLADIPPYILLHFQFDSDGHLTSPQVPTGNMQDLAEERGYATHETIQARAARLAELGSVIRRDILVSALERKRRELIRMARAPEPIRDVAAAQPQLARQRKRNHEDWQWRQQYTQQAEMQEQLVTPTVQADAAAHDEVMSAVWIGDALVLARKATVDKHEYVQGCWLDWPALETWLLAQVGDLLPDADLTPVSSGTGEDYGHMLAALPVVLNAGVVPAEVAGGISPIRVALIIAWVCVVGAAIMVALLLRGAVALSERRGAFVSAVTHELRTPLTTFRMYTEMLADNILKDPGKRQNYLETLRTEADRLGHLVENVLAYAQLDGGRFGNHLETVAWRELLDRLSGRLVDRANRAGMELVVNTPDDGNLPALRVDLAAVEQILFNLVDNACKYAATGDNRTIELGAERSAQALTLTVRDHGPGISKRDIGRLFRPFSKSAQEAAHTAPGLGLGLALSRRLARRMGGELRLERTTNEGTCFVFSLPLK